MTYYLGKVLSSCKDLYNDVNAAYLTGALDIIVIKQKDGSLKSTPFHVRFGKLGVLRTGDLKEVSIYKLTISCYIIILPIVLLRRTTCPYKHVIVINNIIIIMYSS